jgi:DNA-binding IclR family transcriptional regulator
MVVAALGISGPAERLEEARLVQAGKTLMTAAAQISRRLGYSGR